MANLALLRESRLHVIGVRGRVEVVQVARNATAVGEVVVAVHMALRALHAGVSAGQGESSGGMVERGPAPRHS